jgi:bleomycin hydrolase
LVVAADVGKDQNPQRGIMALGISDHAAVFGIKEKLTKAERLSFYDGGPNHAMVLMGVDMQKDKPAKWLVENSWGKERGHGGYWSLYDDWFNEHVYMVVVKKAYVPAAIVKMFEQQPAVLG